MQRFKLINELAVAGENFARMNMNRRRLKQALNGVSDERNEFMEQFNAHQGEEMDKGGGG